MRIRSLALTLLVATACNGAAAGGSDSANSGTGESGTGGAGQCEDSALFAYLYFEVAPSPATTGTRSVQIFVDAGSCLSEYYTDPESEPEDDSGVGCIDPDRACDAPSLADKMLSCDLVQVTETKSGPEGKEVVNMAFHYEVPDEPLDGKVFPFGPLPTEAKLGCEPVVAPAQMRGLDGMQQMLWQTEDFSPPSATIGVTELVVASP